MHGDAAPLEAALRRVLARLRVPPDPLCAALLDTLVVEGLRRARVDDPDGARDDEALAHWRRLLDALTQQARILRIDRLPPAAVLDTLGRLCPLWPFCG